MTNRRAADVELIVEKEHGIEGSESVVEDKGDEVGKDAELADEERTAAPSDVAIMSHELAPEDQAAARAEAERSPGGGTGREDERDR